MAVGDEAMAVAVHGYRKLSLGHDMMAGSYKCRAPRMPHEISAVWTEATGAEQTERKNG